MREKNVLASVEAVNNTEAGIVLRCRDLDNYLVGLHNHLLRAIYIFERREDQAPFQ